MKIKSEDSAVYNLSIKDKEDAVIENALAILKNRMKTHETTISSSSDAINFVKLKIGLLEHEVFSVLFLNTKHQLIEYDEMFRGTINVASVYPREILKKCLSVNADAIIIAHNHPSGIVEASMSDKKMTTAIQNALSYIDVNFLDHIIVGGNNCLSFADKDML